MLLKQFYGYPIDCLSFFLYNKSRTAKEEAVMEKKPRLIFHCDCNNFFASCEILERPELRDVPMAVAGDPENRLGVVVAKMNRQRSAE